MIAPNREAVINNIKTACEQKNFHAKVEVDDPVYTDDERRTTLERYMRVRKTPYFKVLNWIAGRTLDLITWYCNRDTQIEGLENLKDLKESAIITSNHFNPNENTTIRFLSQKLKRGNLHIVSQDTNLAMKGMVGFYMNYVDIIPISKDSSYMKKHFQSMMKSALKKGQNILIYPEEEMWFNYRKPRPPKRGAYYYAALLNAPIISCFVEIIDLPKMKTKNFHKTKYILHVLPVIYPDKSLNQREKSLKMMYTDYQQKKEAYEKCYQKKLDYIFSEWDIAGWEAYTADLNSIGKKDLK